MALNHVILLGIFPNRLSLTCTTTLEVGNSGIKVTREAGGSNFAFADYLRCKFHVDFLVVFFSLFYPTLLSPSRH